MKKEKYYYSEPLYNAKMNVIVNAKQQVVMSNAIVQQRPLPRVTICGVYDNEDNTMTYGVAVCSERDTFNRKLGQKISYNRAFVKPYRTVFIHPTDKISKLFIENAREIEKEILNNKVI